MSYGTVQRFESKAKLIKAVKEQGPDAVFVFDTSAFGNKGTVPVSALAGSPAEIVGPDVERDRRWYANVKVMKSGEIRIV